MIYYNLMWCLEEGRLLLYVFFLFFGIEQLVFLESYGNVILINLKVCVWLQGGVYGNEFVGDQVLFVFLGKMDVNQIWVFFIFENVDIFVLFCYNFDGVVYF